jgi:uncharacterized protein (TIGR03437 family)
LLLFAAPSQVNYIIPPETAPGIAKVTVFNAKGPSIHGTIQVASFFPGLFSANGNGEGVAAAHVVRVRADGSRSLEQVARLDAASARYIPVPIDLGPPSDKIFVSFYGTGIRGFSAASGLTVLMNDQSVRASYAGPQGEFEGLDQVNVPLPRVLGGRTVNVALFGEGKVSNSVQLVIR